MPIRRYDHSINLDVRGDNSIPHLISESGPFKGSHHAVEESALVVPSVKLSMDSLAKLLNWFNLASAMCWSGELNTSVGQYLTNK